MPDPASGPVGDLRIPRRREHPPILLPLILPLPPLLLPSVLLLPELPVVQKPRERHEEPEYEQELDVRLLVHHVIVVADRVVEDVVVEALFVIQNVILNEVCNPLGEGPVLLWFCGSVRG